jgi:hypothetical protein
MAIAQAAAFLALASGLVVLSLLAIARLGILRLESPLSRDREGLRPGRRVPAWERADLSGERHVVPRGHGWQLLMFADHSLREFPDLLPGLRRLAEEPELETLLLPRANPELSALFVERVGVDVPVVPVDQDFYNRHEVQLMPLAMFVDGEGVVRATHLVAHEDVLLRMWEDARGGRVVVEA